jgi:hypothetical protein
MITANAKWGSSRQGRTLLSLILALTVAILLVFATESARAHGVKWAAAETPFIDDGNVWGKGKSYASNYHRKQCVTVWLQEWDNDQWVSAQGWYDCKYDHSGYVYSEDVTNCGWGPLTITEKYRTKAKAEYYDIHGNLVHQDVDYSQAKTLSC